MRTLQRHNLRNVSNNVTIPEGTWRLIKVNKAVWYESSFGKICREVIISILGIMDNFVDFEVYTAVYYGLSMAITTRNKTTMGVLPLLTEDFVHSIKFIINIPTAHLFIDLKYSVSPWWRIQGKIPSSVESPSMVDPQWDIWYWGSKWNLHTICWNAVGCEWGTTSVYFGITYVCFVPSRLPVFAVEPQYLLQDFLFLSKVSFEGHIQNLQKISCWFKIWMRFVGPILIKLWTSCIWGFP